MDTPPWVIVADAAHARRVEDAAGDVAEGLHIQAPVARAAPSPLVARALHDHELDEGSVEAAVGRELLEAIGDGAIRIAYVHASPLDPRLARLCASRDARLLALEDEALGERLAALLED